MSRYRKKGEIIQNDVYYLSPRAEHGITKEEVEEVLENPEGIESSRSSSRPIAFGEASTGRIIAVVYEQLDQDTVYPVTAYQVQS